MARCLAYLSIDTSRLRDYPCSQCQKNRKSNISENITNADTTKADGLPTLADKGVTATINEVLAADANPSRPTPAQPPTNNDDIPEGVYQAIYHMLVDITGTTTKNDYVGIATLLIFADVFDAPVIHMCYDPARHR
jgi:hypothetical protein